MRHRPVLRHDHLSAGWERAGLAGLGNTDASLSELVQDLTVVLRLPPSLPGAQGVGHHVRVPGGRH